MLKNSGRSDISRLIHRLENEHQLRELSWHHRHREDDISTSNADARQAVVLIFHRSCPLARATSWLPTTSCCEHVFGFLEYVAQVKSQESVISSSVKKIVASLFPVHVYESCFQMTT